MSEPEVRRPRRIIPADPATPVAGAVPRLAERFMRALQQGRRVDPAAQRRTGAQPPPAARDTELPVARDPEGPDLPPAAEVARAPRLVRWVDGPQEASPSEPGDAAELAHARGRWDGELAHTVALLCLRTDPAIEAWMIVVPMDPAVLPQTELHLHCSRSRVLLRFHTLSALSLTLLWRHRRLLASLLRQAVAEAEQIDIEIT